MITRGETPAVGPALLQQVRVAAEELKEVHKLFFRDVSHPLSHELDEAEVHIQSARAILEHLVGATVGDDDMRVRRCPPMAQDASTEAHRSHALSDRIAELSPEYAIGNLSGLSPLSTRLWLLDEVERAFDGCGEMELVVEAAMDALPDSTDRDKPEAVLTAAIALQRVQADRLHGIMGNLLLIVQESTTAPKLPAQGSPAGALQ